MNWTRLTVPVHVVRSVRFGMYRASGIRHWIGADNPETAVSQGWRGKYFKVKVCPTLPNIAGRPSKMVMENQLLRLEREGLLQP